MTTEPSPEVRAILKYWITMQREKYGEDWKKKLAVEMASSAERLLTVLINRSKAS